VVKKIIPFILTFVAGVTLTFVLFLTCFSANRDTNALDRIIADEHTIQLTNQQRYQSDLDRLTKQNLDSETKAGSAVRASQDASDKYARLLTGVKQFEQSSVQFDTAISNGLSGDIDLCDAILTDLDRYEAGLKNLQRLSSENGNGSK